MEWSVKSTSLSIAVFVGVCIAVTTALPLATELYTNDLESSLLLDTCRMCFIYADADACYTCNMGVKEANDDDGASIEKRSFFNPLLRGGYPKKSTYYPYYNPLNRGAYFKKSYSPPAYHPFLRGGYRPPIQRTYWNRQPTQDDELP